ncbi:MaoC family dehydratase N-terminal domain-containing protein [Gottfriedia acidiceleris]|uniref:MaoC family dehydratase N-terminal domain-containing protein n=1 Tax=Gottfriedia acidiceleris TaxID=371036 RepID=A0ABY4JN30_9BACI|nr:MaoC family dehydratase N-terminal domain-containing protein [Gottfriedia acidiceleris]UPM55229.1 MaoC family dehydratase N-terminal domain-containing protein [Gottfriedia acidiceleris]
MSKVEELVGLKFEPYTLAVEQGKIRELARAIGDDNPIYYDLEVAKKEGYEGIPIPPTFFQVIDLWGGLGSTEKMEKMKLNLVRVLHGKQEYEYLGDIVAGDVLSVTSEVVDVETKTGRTGVMEFITSENQYRNQRGELVAKARSTIVHRL